MELDAVARLAAFECLGEQVAIEHAARRNLFARTNSR
jgi:hypothetical protein